VSKESSQQSLDHLCLLGGEKRVEWSPRPPSAVPVLNAFAHRSATIESAQHVTVSHRNSGT
jgi:hypothetical protein